MPDMLVKLYTLPDLAACLTQLRTQNIEVRRARAWEKRIVSSWVREQFKETWAVACEVALEQRPVSCYIAVEQQGSPAVGNDPKLWPTDLLVGFACYDVAGKGVFGPTGVREDRRGGGIGRGLLLATLHAMLAEGYAYAIIGEVGPADFYNKTVGATLIEGSDMSLTRRNLIGANPA